MATLFVLLSESEVTHPWMRSNQYLQDEVGVNTYIEQLKTILHVIDIEEFRGFFDLNNVENFLSDFDTLDDYYPHPVRTRLRFVLRSLDGWRDSIFHEAETQYHLFHQKLEDHTFCEVAYRKWHQPGENILLINHHAHSLPSPINIRLNHSSVSFESAATIENVSDWFFENRQPERDFHAIEKHGENRQESRMSNRGSISPLKSSAQYAKTVLRTALGNTKHELFGYDDERDEFIVYKYEGDNGQNLYHGYHQPRESSEIPDHIKQRLIANYNRFIENR
jgi:hypothetical protein